MWCGEVRSVYDRSTLLRCVIIAIFSHRVRNVFYLIFLFLSFGREMSNTPFPFRLKCIKTMENFKSLRGPQWTHTILYTLSSTILICSANQPQTYHGMIYEA